MAQLVVANASFKTYPGGVIVLRAADWMGGARGTLSSESDARSACGTVVRDSQEAASAPFTSAQLNAAADTLVIPLGDLPLEDDLTKYMVLASVLIEGDWDPANGDTSFGGHQEIFSQEACTLSYWGDPESNPLTNPYMPNYQPRGLDGYRIIGYGGNYGLNRADLGDPWSDFTLTWRFLRSAGCTVEYLIDQIYLVPSVSPSPASGWSSDDFEMIPGAEGTFGAYSLDPDDGPPLFIDGADGGDDQGKFTWHPIVFDQQTQISGADGGGDYQRVSDEADAEYMVRVIPDQWFLQNSETDAEANAHCYGIHGPHFIPEQDWVDDDFGRTVSDGNFAGADGHFVTDSGWGLTPEGFSWASFGQTGPETSILHGHRWGIATYVDGNAGVIAMRNDSQDDLLVAEMTLALNPEPASTREPGAVIRTDNIRMAGTFTRDIDVASDNGGDRTIQLRIRNSRGGDPHSLYILLYPNLVWEFHPPAGALVASGTNAWASIGWRLEILRYVVRMRVWDASGAEPSTWDYEEFRQLEAEEYDYDDNLEIAIEEADVHAPTIAMIMGGVTMNGTPARVFHEYVTVENDPIGDQASAFASIEQPEGTVRGEIEMPDCQHLVYWGTRDWTTLDFGSPYLDFSAKVWNDPTAAELQRSEAIWWWFRTTRPGLLIPTNWRAYDRQGNLVRLPR